MCVNIGNPAQGLAWKSRCVEVVDIRNSSVEEVENLADQQVVIEFVSELPIDQWCGFRCRSCSNWSPLIGSSK
jgi:hypothetical protein